VPSGASALPPVRRTVTAAIPMAAATIIRNGSGDFSARPTR
jgi:hypothetical protein